MYVGCVAWRAREQDREREREKGSHINNVCLEASEVQHYLHICMFSDSDGKKLLHVSNK